MRRTIWLGIMAPAGTPQPIVDKLNAEINKVLSRPTSRKRGPRGAVAMAMTPAEIRQVLRADIDKWANVVKVRAKVE